MAGKPIARMFKNNAAAVLNDAALREQTFDYIFDLMASGHDGKSWRGDRHSFEQKTNFALICQEMKLDYLTMWEYVNFAPGMRQRFDNVLKARADRIVDEILDIADRPAKDMTEAVDKKTRIEARKYVAKVNHREAYGDKIEINTVNINLVGVLDEANKRLEKVIEGERLGQKL